MKLSCVYLYLHTSCSLTSYIQFIMKSCQSYLQNRSHVCQLLTPTLQSGWACAWYLARLTPADGLEPPSAFFSCHGGCGSRLLEWRCHTRPKPSGCLNCRERSCPGKPASCAAGISQAGHWPCSVIKRLAAGCCHIMFHCCRTRKTNCLPLSPNRLTVSAVLPPLISFLSKAKRLKCM